MSSLMSSEPENAIDEEQPGGVHSPLRRVGNARSFVRNRHREEREDDGDQQDAQGVGGALDVVAGEEKPNMQRKQREQAECGDGFDDSHQRAS